MMERAEFQQKLAELLKLAADQGGDLKKEDILHGFGAGALSREQMESLYQYLKIQGIRVEGVDLGNLSAMDHTSEGREAEEKAEEKKPIPLEPEDEHCLREYEEYLEIFVPEKEGEREYLLAELAGGAEHVRERLTQVYLTEILEQAKELHREGVFLADLIQEGNMALLTFAPEDLPMEARDSWMKNRIRESMESWIRELTDQKLRDESMVEKVRKLEAAIKELTDDEDQKFSVEELSAYLDMEEEEIRAVLRLASEEE